MNKARSKTSPLLFLLMVFVMFPFTQLIPLSTYNQPYALLTAGLIVSLSPSSYLRLPQADRLMLGYLFLLGCVLFPFAMLDGLVFREVSYLMSYITPLITTAACYWALRSNPSVVRTSLKWGILVWIGVALIQMTIDSSFLTFLSSKDTELGENLVNSGRGVLGLAPEPTHFAFHMIVLSTCLYLIGGPLWVVLLGLAATILFAQSSSALLAFGVGSILWALMRPVARFWVFLSIAGLISISALLPFLLDESSRISRVILSVSSTGFDVIYQDYSVNARLSGMFAPIWKIWNEGFLPLGMSLNAWAEARNELLSKFPWIINLSSGGPASGIGMVLLQAGFLGIPPVVYIFVRLVVTNKATVAGFLTTTCFVVFYSQLYLATPIIGLLLASIIASTRAEIARSHQSSPHLAESAV